MAGLENGTNGVFQPTEVLICQVRLPLPASFLLYYLPARPCLGPLQLGADEDCRHAGAVAVAVAILGHKALSVRVLTFMHTRCNPAAASSFPGAAAASTQLLP